MLSINIPNNLNIIINETHIKAKGPHGLFIKKKSKNIKLYQKNRKIFLLASKKSFYLSILNKFLWGISKGFCKKLKIIGVGYKVSIQEKQLIMRLGFSHNIIFDIPDNIYIYSPQANLLVIFGNNWNLVTQIAAKIRLYKLPEPYKGKGILYINEVIKKKEGKKN